MCWKNSNQRRRIHNLHRENNHTESHKSQKHVLNGMNVSKFRQKKFKKKSFILVLCQKKVYLRGLYEKSVYFGIFNTINEYRNIIYKS